MYKKFIAIAIFATSYVTINAHNSYTLLPSANDERVVIKVMQDTPITGLDSDGKHIILHLYKVKELYLDPIDAFDLGLRHTNEPIVHDALYKLARQGRTLDMNDTLVIIRDALNQAHVGKLTSYWIGGVFGTGIAALSIMFENQPPATRSTIVRNCLLGCVFGGIPALAGYLSYRSTSSFYANIMQQIIQYPVFRIRNQQMFIELVREIRSLLRTDDAKTLNNFINTITYN